MKSIKYALLWVLFLGLLVSTAAAGELPTAVPEDVGVSSEKLARIKPAMQKFVDDQQVAGVITIVARHGKVAYFETVGFRDLDAKKPMERDTICRFYSMTKPITSVAVMMLVEEGKIGLDDPASKFIPEFKGLKVFVKSDNGTPQTEEPKRDVTVRDLLRHTSGLTYGLFGETPVDRMYREKAVLAQSNNLQGMMKKLSDIPLLCQPGTKFNYSVSTDVLGHLVEVVSGKPLDEFFAERVFKPLDMKDTGFYVPEEKLGRFAATHGVKPEGGLKVTDPPATSPFRKKPKLLSGGGGSVSTARDYLRFCQMILNKGQLDEVRLLKPETVEMMTRNQLPESAYPICLGGLKRSGVGFGLGFSVVVEKPTADSPLCLGEYGWGGAASTHFWISPKDDLAVVVLTQYMPFNQRLEAAVKPLVYEAIVDRK